MKDLFGLPQTVIYGNSLPDWAIAFSVAILVLLLLLIARRFIVARHGRYLQSGRVEPVRLIAQLAGGTRQFFMIPFAVYVGERWLTLGARIERASSYAMLLLVLTQVGIWATRAITFLIAEREARELGRAAERRAIFSMGVQYETPVEKLALVPKLVAEAVAPERRASGALPPASIWRFRAHLRDITLFTRSSARIAARPPTRHQPEDHRGISTQRDRIRLAGAESDRPAG